MNAPYQGLVTEMIEDDECVCPIPPDSAYPEDSVIMRRDCPVHQHWFPKVAQ